MCGGLVVVGDLYVLYSTEENLSELARDKSLLGDWDIAWRFEGEVSAPLLRALDEAGIP